MTTKRKTPTKKKTAKKKAAKKTAKKKTTKKSSDNVTMPTGKSVTAFINAVDNETRRKDAKTVLAMMKRLTGDKPKMWGPSIVGFGSYHYVYDSGREGDCCIVGFSPRKANMVLYVLGSLKDDDPLIAKIGKFKRGVSCLYVNKLDDVDLKVLEKIIVKSYKNTKNYWAKKAAR